MTTTTVTTQDQLDTALAGDYDTIIIDSERGVWLTVSASGSATVRAYDSATVRAYGSATVDASKYVPVHLFSSRVTLSGGVLIDLTRLDLTDITDWIDYHGVARDGDTLTVYKAVDGDLFAGHRHTPTQYAVGSVVTAPDWQATAGCGYGLHFGATPHGAAKYYSGEGVARYLECTVAVAETVALSDKVKSRSCTVVREVTIDGEPVRA